MTITSGGEPAEVSWYADESARACISAVVLGDTTELTVICDEVARSPQDAIVEIVRQLATLAAEAISRPLGPTDRRSTFDLVTTMTGNAAIAEGLPIRADGDTERRCA